MNQIAANEDGLTITRDGVPPCAVRWEELRSIDCHRMFGVTSLEFNYITGGFLSADGDMAGFGQVLKMLDVYVRIGLPGWREQVAALATREMAGRVLHLYVREQPELSAEETSPSNAAARFPRAAGYNTQWLIDNVMGPNPLWLAEWLMESLELKPGMRVLDLGCGRAASSIFLAKEFGVSVWAADVWVKPADNALRIREAGVENLVTPIYAEARALPFAHDYFDAIVSIDAYHYFGTDDLYLGYLARYLRPRGRLGIVVPTMAAELGEEVPAHLRPYWDWEFCSFHTPAWWRHHWTKSGWVEVETADAMEGGASLWLQWADACAEKGPAPWKEAMAKEAEMLRIDAGATFGFARVVAYKK
jgi:SAM-dependent methyltransferase